MMTLFRHRIRNVTGGLLALALLVISAQAQADTSLRLRFTTGGDNLRGGGNDVHVRFLDASGRERQRLRNGNKSATWDNGSINDVALLDVGTVGELASVEVSVSDRSRHDIFEEADHWNLEALLITVVADGVERTLLDARSTPLHRFTAGGPPQVFALTHVEDRCASDSDCSDGLYCTGDERCLVNRDGNPAVLRVCERASVVCSSGMFCDESIDVCRLVEVDEDRDGARSNASGGTDCDDNDARRFPGNVEVCDNEGRDEDCDLSTSGARDIDGDGHQSANCFNWGPPGR